MKKIIVFFLVILNFIQANSQLRGEKILAIFAHPDDEEAVAPILVKYAQKGISVDLVICTDGRYGVNEYNDYEAGDELVEIRKNEMKCAADKLGVNLIHLNYHDQLKAREGFNIHIPHVRKLILELNELIDSIQPDVIITWGPDGGTNHLDHMLVSTSVTQVFLSKNWNKEISLYYYGTPNYLIKDKKDKTLRGQEKKYLKTEISFDENHFNIAYDALLCHESQYPKEIVRKLKEERKLNGNKVYLRKFSSPSIFKKSLF
jgi:LmbE family N-acetylglucosaminyl deacetylase